MNSYEELKDISRSSDRLSTFLIGRHSSAISRISVLHSHGVMPRSLSVTRIRPTISLISVIWSAALEGTPRSYRAWKWTWL